MSQPRILGITVIRNDWPLAGLAISHALLHHVDEVVVVDHGSTDGTVVGLAGLQTRFAERLTVYRADLKAFWQEATVAAALSARGADEFDWVYVFDADEFLLTGAQGGLRDVVAAVDPQVAAVRYELDNLVAPTDFQETEVERYTELTQRAVPNTFDDPPGEMLGDEIFAGTMNFFDLPFPSKVVVRWAAERWLAAGSHYLKAPDDALTVSPGRDHVRAAHLSMLGMSRVLRKADHGQLLRESGFPPVHGWQNQLLDLLRDAGGLDDFWSRHSVGTPPSDSALARPTLVDDEGFSAAIAPAIELVLDLPSEPSELRPTALPEHLIATINAYQRHADAARAAQREVRDELASVARDRATLIDRHRELLDERARLVAHQERVDRELRMLSRSRDDLRDQLRAEHEAVVDERGRLLAAYERSVAEGERTAQELRQAQEELRHAWSQYTVLAESKSWKITAPLRGVMERRR